jgi:hypothetical protein
VRPETFEKVADALGRSDLRLPVSMPDVAGLPISRDVPACELVGDVRLAGMLLPSAEAARWASSPNPTWETFYELPENVRTFVFEHVHNRSQQAIEEAREWTKVKAPITEQRVWKWRSRSARGEVWDRTR